MITTDDFEPVADSDSELSLICPLCGEWITVRPEPPAWEWLNLRQLRGLAEVHLAEKHRPAIEGVASTRDVADTVAGQLRQDPPAQPPETA